MTVIDRNISFDPDLDEATRATLEDLLAGWPQTSALGDITVTKLSGGASNVNVRVSAGENAWAVRVCAPEASRWGVLRAAAIQAQQDAAVLGLAPEIFATRLPEGHFLSEFVDGTTVTSEYVREAGLIPRIAQTLRALKLGTTTSRDFSPFDDFRTFLELGDAEGANVANDLAEFIAAVVRVEALFQTRDAPRGFCHSDLVPQNFLLTPEGLKMVDFDYAGNGWVAFELASFACQAELDAEETEQLLSSYDPDVDDGGRARVELMRMVAGVREALWCYMAEPILSASTKPLDGWTYSQHAARNLGQAKLTIGDGGLDRYLKEARNVRPGALF